MKNEDSVPRATSKFEWIINIALALVAIMFIGVMVQKFFLSSKPKDVKPLQTGMKLNLPGIEWARDGQTLVMALSTNCHFCTESAPLYRRLANELGSKSETRVVAVLPQKTDEGRQYLKKLEVPVGDVMQADLESLGFMATPTLMIVKNDGTIADMWVGTLKVSDQFTLFNRLNIKNDELAKDGSGPTMIDALTLKHALDKKAALVIVDVEDRDTYQWEHIPGAVNIPVDELEARANDELSPTDTIVVYCHTEELTNRAAEILTKNDGFRLVSVLKGGLAEWEKAGLPKEKYPTKK
jgi:rhodanese-related sulfurtransferase